MTDARLPPEFSFSNGDWTRWYKTFTVYLGAAGKLNAENKTKICVLLNCMGTDGMDVFNTFDVDMDKATFPEVVKLFEEHCYPLKNETFERYKFWSRNQLENETIDNYITALKNLANTCAFESQKDKMLRDKLVFGVNDSTVKERLLREASLDFKKAVDICRAAESSKSKLKQMTTASKPEQQVYKISKTRFGFSVTQCGYCGSNHQRGKCPAFGTTCSACGKKNHFKQVCRTKKMTPSGQ